MDKKLDTILLDSVDIKDTQDEMSPISPAIKFLYIVRKIDNSALDDESEKTKILFFRGQSKESWKVDPSVFREDQLNIEHELIREAIRRSPDVLANKLTNFERLTQLQHYELATRLLDVTENPLIALYFACEQESEHDGAVYLTHTYPIDANSLEVQILAHIAHLDVRQITLRDLWVSLKKDGVDLPAIESDVDLGLLDNYVNLMKRNYFVRANLDNARIKQQSGAFLLSGCIDTIMQKNKWDSVLEKKGQCLAAEFTHKIIIPADLKEDLLTELDLYNINEATVYPELDHQMHYIKKMVKRRNIFTSPAVISSDDSLAEKTTLADKVKEPDYFYQQDNLIPENLHGIILFHVKKDDLVEPLHKIFAESAKIDWPIRKQLQAAISRNMTRFLLLQDFAEKETCSEIAKSILEDALNAI